MKGAFPREDPKVHHGDLFENYGGPGTPIRNIIDTSLCQCEKYKVWSKDTARQEESEVVWCTNLSENDHGKPQLTVQRIKLGSIPTSYLVVFPPCIYSSLINLQTLLYTSNYHQYISQTYTISCYADQLVQNCFNTVPTSSSKSLSSMKCPWLVIS
jgi:hypothetical protein